VALGHSICGIVADASVGDPVGDSIDLLAVLEGQISGLELVRGSVGDGRVSADLWLRLGFGSGFSLGERRRLVLLG
jgi:hypothetical protein